MVLLGKHRAVLLSVSKMPSKATIVTLNANQAKLKWPDIMQTKCSRIATINLVNVDNAKPPGPMLQRFM